jgi:ABC-2 type transport system permease protein
VLLAWGAGVAAAGLVVGALLPTVEQYLATDASYRDMLVLMGMDVTQLTMGFVGLWAALLGLVIALYSAFRMGATRAEEASTRADFLLSRPVRRWRWLGGHVLCVVASVVLLCTAAGAAMWLAGLATGAKISASDAFGAMFNTLPMVTVFVGLSVLVFGVAPRLTVVVGAGAAVVAYVLQMVGPALKWPDWLVGVSPFHHLEAVPVDPFGWPAAIVMVVVGVAFTVAGLVAFQRRDLVGV